MTCAHVLDLIDAGPFAGCAPEQVKAALAHARACAACGQAVAASTLLAEDLLVPPEILVPPDLEKMVMTRIFRLEILPAAPEPVSRAWPAWAVAAGGSTAAAAFAIELASVRKLVAARPEVVVVLLTLGLLIYSAGLFAPLVTRAGRSHSSSS
jgi:hypothetical protein